MKPYFTCYVEGGGDQWQAACVDFDLAVSATSRGEVEALLEFAVRTYIRDAMAEAEPARTQLLRRRAPWTTRVKWRLRVAVATIGVKRGLPSVEARYALPCPA